MKVRTITAAIILAVAIPILIFSKYIVYPIALALVALAAVFELLRVIGAHREWIISVPAYIISLALPLSAYFVTESTRIIYLLSAAAVVFAYMLYLMCAAVFSHGRIAFSKIGEAFVAVTYIVISLSSLSTIRYMTHGMFCFLLVFLTAWGSDVMAYVVGSLMGKHKLIPEVSPKKTVEGAIGGILSAILACILYGYIIECLTDVCANYLSLSLIGLLLSVVSQIGDLIASLIKREYGVKDYGNLLPGHGGIMDRFDSVLAVSAPLMVICLVIPPFQ